MERRNFIERVGKTTAIGASAGLAGCIGSTAVGRDGSVTKFRYGCVGSEDTNCLGCVDPYGAWTLADRLEQKSNGDIQMQVIGDSQLCSTTNCLTKARANVVETASNSLGNSTKFMPENNLWVLPYLFPPDNRAALSYALFHPETWRRWWVPLAEEYGVMPFLGYPSQHRVIHIGTAAAGNFNDGRMTRPEHITGLSIRRTLARTSVKSINAWGANPVKLSWGDTIQGLKSGVVAGLETWLTNVAAFAMLPVIGQTIKNNWCMGCQMSWVSVDWLREISADHRELLAQETHRLTDTLVGLSDEVMRKRAGAVQPPRAEYAAEGVTVNKLDDQQLDAWQESVGYKQNPDRYSKTLEQAGTLLGSSEDAREFADFLWNLSRGSSVPDNPNELSVRSWWDDHLHKI